MNENDKGCAGLAIKDSVLPVRDAQVQREQIKAVHEVCHSPVCGDNCSFPRCMGPEPEEQPTVFKSISDDVGFVGVLGQYSMDVKHGKGISATLPLTQYIDRWHAINRHAAALAQAAPASPNRPTDDELWDATLRDRDTYHEWADKLADAIATYFGVDIGEHSNQNLPWSEALDAIPASPASAPMDERAAFEVWHSKKFGWLSERNLILNSNYADYRAQERWEIWQARAVLAAPLPPVVARKVLTDEEIEQIVSAAHVKCVHPAADTTKDIARAIERHLMGGE